MLRSLLILISVVTGVITGYHTQSYITGIVWILLGVSVYIIIDSVFRHNLSKILVTARLHSVWPCFVLAGLASISATICVPNPASIPEKTEYYTTGEVMDRNSTTRGEQYVVNILSIYNHDRGLTECRNLRVFLHTSESQIFTPGDVISWTSTFIPLENPIPGRPRYLCYDMIRVYDGGVTKSGKEKFHYRDGNLHIVGHNEGILPFAWRIRESFTIYLENSGMTKETTQLLQALLTGRRHGISPERLAGFRDAGVAHALAVSGMHVGILTGILMLLSVPMNVVGGWKWRFLLAVIGAWGFALLTGLQLSTVRATIMLTLMALGEFHERRLHPFSSLCRTAAIMLILSPTALWDIGFQLSFTCVAALIIFVGPLNPINKREHKLLHSLVATLLTTIVATGATWVISAHYFGSVPLHFLSANMIILPLLPLLMVLGLLQTTLYGLGMEVAIIKESLRWVAEVLFKVIDSLANGAIALEPSVNVVILWLLGIFAIGTAIHIDLPMARTLPGCRPFPMTQSSYSALHPNKTLLLTGASLLFVAIGLMIAGV